MGAWLFSMEIARCCLSQLFDKLLAEHSANRAQATVITTELENPTGYGRAIVDESGRLKEIVEEKAATAEQKKVREINSGIYCFEAPLLWKHLAEITPNPASNEYYLTDIVDIFNRSGTFSAHSAAPRSRRTPWNQYAGRTCGCR